MNNIKSLLLENRTVKQTIFKNTFWITLSIGISKFLKLILIIYVARVLGTTDYGKFTFAFAFVSLFLAFSDFGLSAIITREFSREQEKEKEFSAVFTLKILLSLGTLILILAGSFFITSNLLIQKIIWILAFYLLFDSFCEIIFAFFRARQKIEYEAWARMLTALIITTVGLFVLFNFPSVETLSYGYLFSALIVLIFLLIIFHFKIYSLSLNFNKDIWQQFLSMSWPLALLGFFGAIYTSIDSTMMGYWGQIIQTGWYNAACRIIGALIVPVALIYYSFYPALSRAYKKSKKEFQNLWNLEAEIMIFLALPLVIGGMILAPKIIDFIYDSSFSPAVFAFQILILMAGIIFINSLFAQALIVCDQQKKNFLVALICAIVNIILNIILIPKFSLYGAAIATVLTYFLMFYLLLKFTLKFTPIRFFNFKILLIFIGTVLSGGLMYFVISWPAIFHLHVLFVVSIGIIAYSGFYFLYRKLTIRFV